MPSITESYRELCILMIYSYLLWHVCVCMHVWMHVCLDQMLMCAVFPYYSPPYCEAGPFP